MKYIHKSISNIQGQEKRYVSVYRTTFQDLVIQKFTKTKDYQHSI